MFYPGRGCVRCWRTAKVSAPRAGGSDSVKDSTNLDDNGVPEDSKIDFFKSELDIPIYEIQVDGEGNVLGRGYTPAYRVYQTLKAAVPNGHIRAG